MMTRLWREFHWCVRLVRGEVAFWATRFGYWLRPYDMRADRRRWRWQKRSPCVHFWFPYDGG